MKPNLPIEHAVIESGFENALDFACSRAGAIMARRGTALLLGSAIAIHSLTYNTPEIDAISTHPHEDPASISEVVSSPQSDSSVEPDALTDNPCRTFRESGSNEQSTRTKLPSSIQASPEHTIIPIFFGGDLLKTHGFAQSCENIVTAHEIIAEDANKGATVCGADKTSLNTTDGFGGFYNNNDLQALVKLWLKESGWRTNAVNRSSGAAGIGQLNPQAGHDVYSNNYRFDAATQIRRGLSYICGRYNTPSEAWQWWQQKNWY